MGYCGGSKRALPDYVCPCGKTFRLRWKIQKYCNQQCMGKHRPSPKGRMPLTKEQFLSTITINGECWERVPRGGSVGAYKRSWEMHFGAIPEGMEVCHHCDNPKCVRPDHLFLGTHADNIRDCYNKGRMSNLKGANNPNYRHGKRVKQFT